MIEFANSASEMQVEDILAGDKQLAKEILYDMKQANLTKESNAAPAMPEPPPVTQAHGQQSVPTAACEQSSHAAPAFSRPGLSPRGGTGSRHSHSSTRRSSGVGGLVVQTSLHCCTFVAACAETRVSDSIHVLHAAITQYVICIQFAAVNFFWASAQHLVPVIGR